MKWENQEGKTDIKSLTLAQLKEEMAALGEKPFRAQQLYQWMHQKLARDYDSMTNLPQALRERLQECYACTCLQQVRMQESRIDGTRKYLFALEDGHVVESVWMPRWAAGWAAGSALPRWGAWCGTCGLRRCWIRSMPSVG